MEGLVFVLVPGLTVEGLVLVLVPGLTVDGLEYVLVPGRTFDGLVPGRTVVELPDPGRTFVGRVFGLTVVELPDPGRTVAEPGRVVEPAPDGRTFVLFTPDVRLPRPAVPTEADPLLGLTVAVDGLEPEGVVYELTGGFPDTPLDDKDEEPFVAVNPFGLL